MINTINIFFKIGEVLKELLSEQKKGIFFTKISTTQPQMFLNEYIEYLNKIREALSKLQMLDKDERENIPGYIHDENIYRDRAISKIFSTKNYHILSYNDRECDESFPRYDFVLLDENKQVVLKECTLYDIGRHDTKVKYMVAHNWQEKTSQILERIEQDIEDAKKLTVIANVNKLAENAANVSNSRSFKST